MPTTESTELLASSVARSDAQASTASGTSFSTPALSRGLRPRWLRLGSESLSPILVMRPLQRSQAYVGEQSSRNSMRSKALAPPSGTEEYLLGAVPTHVQTTFLRGGRAAELYLAFLRPLCSAPAPLFLCSRSRVAASPPRRLPFDPAFMHSIQSGMVSIAFKPHTRAKKVFRTYAGDRSCTP